MVIFAEVFDGERWNKVGKVFKSTHPELKDKLTDRFYDVFWNNDMSILFHAMCGSQIRLRENVDDLKCDSDERGLPDDISEELKYHKALRPDLYYHKSHLSLDDILNINWDNDVTKYGYISEWQYKRLKEKGICPSHMRYKIHNPHIKIVSNAQMDMLIDNADLKEDYAYYTKCVISKVPLKVMFAEFYDKLKELSKLVPNGETTKNVRIIFGF